MERKGIFAAGNWIIDHVKIIDDYPNQDALANILQTGYGNGGSAYNLLKDLSALEAPFPLSGAGLVGEDANGGLIRQDCQNHGIDTAQLASTQQAPTSFTDVMTVQGSGRRTFFHHRGANAYFDGAALNFQENHSRIFHLGYLLLLNQLDELDEQGRTGASRLFEQATAAGMQTAADVVSESSDRFAKVVAPSLPFLDYLFINEYEAEKVTGIALVYGDGAVSRENSQAAAQKLLDGGVRKAVLLHFADGALGLTKEGQAFWQGSAFVPQNQIAGASGAGDAFAAGCLIGIHEGWAWPQVLQVGVAAAAVSLLEPSCSGGIVPYQQALEKAKAWGFRQLETA